jgi:hypothetical protein
MSEKSAWGEIVYDIYVFSTHLTFTLLPILPRNWGREGEGVWRGVNFLNFTPNKKYTKGKKKAHHRWKICLGFARLDLIVCGISFFL